MRMGLSTAAWAALAAFGALVGCRSEATIDLHPQTEEVLDGSVSTGGTDETGGVASTGGDPVTRPPIPDASVGDADTPVEPDAGPPAASLLLRYDFSGQGSTVVDLAGSADGTVAGGATLTDTGNLLLDGVDDHVAMPPGLLQGHDELTLMAWVTWTGNRCWERILEIGYRDQTTDWMPPVTSLFVTALACGNESVATFIEVDRNMYSVRQGWPLPLDSQSHVVVSLSDEGPVGTLDLYVNGVPVGSGAMPYALSALTDDMAYLGRSLWGHDPYFQGTFHEFRIYGRALTAAEVTMAYEAGPDAL